MMTIAIVGLGLIGGSLCKAVKAHTSHTVLGVDIDAASIGAALRSGAIDRETTALELKTVDIVFVCLNPDLAIDFILNNLHNFKEGGIVADICGIKTAITQRVEQPLLEKGVKYVGAHPMAGREFSGFSYSDSSLFKGANFIITTTSNTSSSAVTTMKELALSMGFGEVVLSSPQEHDTIIAFTSQLAHIVSSAYIKSPTLSGERGFSAGSFKDLTRVARLNEEMWSTLFLLNKEPLLFEINTIIKHLEQFKLVLEEGNRACLKELLKEGRILKEKAID